MSAFAFGSPAEAPAITDAALGIPSSVQLPNGGFKATSTQFLLNQPGRAFLHRACFTEDQEFAGVAWGVHSAATLGGSPADDPCEVAILSAARERLATTGLMSGKLNATGRKTTDALLPFTYLAGVVYYVTFATPTIAGTGATIIGNNFGQALVPVMGGSNDGDWEYGHVAATSPLPATVNPPTTGANATGTALFLYR